MVKRIGGPSGARVRVGGPSRPVASRAMIIDMVGIKIKVRVAS